MSSFFRLNQLFFGTTKILFMYKRYSVLVLAFIVSFSVLSQTEFSRSFGNEGDDNAYSLILEDDNSALLVGVTNSYSTAKGVFLNKVDSTGVLLWSKLISSERSLSTKVVKTTDDGGYILGGSTNAAGAGKKDALLIKIDSIGSIEWSKVYGGKYHEYIFDLIQTEDGGYAMVGETNSFDSQAADILFFKTNKTGDIEWSKAIGDSSVDFGYSIIETIDGYLLANETDSYGAGGYDVSLLKLDKQGVKQWFTTYGGQNDELGYSVVVNDSNEVYMVGPTASFGMGGNDIYLFHLNSMGELLSAKTFGDVYDEQAHRVRLLPDGGLAIVGFTNSYQSQLNAGDAYLIRLNSKLNFKWARVFGGEKDDYALDFEVDKRGDFWIAGETYNYSGRTDKDIYYLKVVDQANPDYCEQARVQTIPLKITEELTVLSHEIYIRNISPLVTEVSFEEKEVAVQQQVICTDGNHFIDGKRKR